MKLFTLLFTPFLAYATSITVSGSPQALIVNQATAGSEPDGALDSSTTYTIQVSKGKAVSISAAVDSLLPAYTTLYVTLAAPSKAISIPSVALSTTPQVVVSGIREGTYNYLPITYKYLATVAAGSFSLSSRTLILTVTSN